jgi:hypothetical protein
MFAMKSFDLFFSLDPGRKFSLKISVVGYTSPSSGFLRIQPECI